MYRIDEVNVRGQRLHSAETGNQGQGEEAIFVHLPPQEEVSLQVVWAEVIFTKKREEMEYSGTWGVKHIERPPKVPQHAQQEENLTVDKMLKMSSSF